MTANTMIAIVQFDWKRLCRSKMFWLLNVLFTVIGFYSAFYGQNEVREQQQKIALLKHDVDSSMELISKKLQTQDTITSWHYDDFMYTLHSNKPDGMAALAFGQRDLHKFAVSLSIGTFFYNKYAGGYENKTLSGEIANSQKQAAGHLDVSFVLVFLLPLYLILISYDLLSSEKEGGTLVLIEVQQTGVREFIFIKLLFRLLIATVAGLVIILAGAAITGAAKDYRLIYYFTATFLYVSSWAGIIGLIISFKKSSEFNALVMISMWLLLCIGMPAAFTAILQTTHPTGTKTDLAEAVQQANVRVFNTSRRDLALRFYKEYPQYNNIPNDTFPGGWYNPRWMRAVHLLLDKEVKPYEDKYNFKLKERINAADMMDFFSPALLAQSIYNEASASDMRQMFAYDTSIYHHFSLWRDYIDYRTYLRGDYLTKKEFEQLPQQDFKPVINYGQLRKKLLAFIIIIVILFTSSSIIINKK